MNAVLTIDDIASKNTPAIADYLAEKGIRAIMFAVGRKLLEYPEEAVYALKKGMIVGNHSYSHPHFSRLSYEEGVDEICRCEEALDRLYRTAGVKRIFRPFRFPYGDKGGPHRAELQAYLAGKGFDKVNDTSIDFPWWKENCLDKDIDTFWTFDFGEYRIRPDSGFTKADVFNRIHDRNPSAGGALLDPGSHHIILMHAHDETEEMYPEYYRHMIDHLLENGVQFSEPEFMQIQKTLI